MKYIKTYEEFKFEEEETDVLDLVKEPHTREPILRDTEADDSILGGKEKEIEDKIQSDKDKVINIQNWKVY